MSQKHEMVVENMTTRSRLKLHHDLSKRQIGVLLVGGLISWAKAHASVH